MTRHQQQLRADIKEPAQGPRCQRQSISCEEGVHAECGGEDEPCGGVRVVWSEESDGEDSEKDGLLMNLEGEEEEGEGRGNLLRDTE